MPAELTLMVLSAVIAEICRRIDLKLEIAKKNNLYRDFEELKKSIYLKTKLHLHHNFIGIGFVIYSFISSNVEAFWLGSGLILHHFLTEGW